MTPDQLTLDDPSAVSPTRDLALYRARAERDVALERVEAAAGEEWLLAAKTWLAEFLVCHPSYFPDRDNVDAPQPAERRAWGAVVRHALAKGWIVKTDTYLPRAHGHTSVAVLYESKLYRGDR